MAAKLGRTAAISCTADEILITSGSLQAIDLVNAVLLARGDTVLIEQETYQGSLTRLARLGVSAVGIPLDGEGMRMDAVAAALDDLARRGVRAKYVYTIPTVHNPTGTIMGEARRRELLQLAHRHGVPIFEDECYSDLVWSGKRPPALHAMSRNGGVIHIGSFSKSIAPALRVGYIVASWDILSRMLALKTDAGSGALEQMVLAEFCAPHFDQHVPRLRRGLRAKLDTLMEALAEHFGTAAEFNEPEGGIYLWVKLPDVVDTRKLAQAALTCGVAINPGAEWTTDSAHGRSRLRLCFAHPSHRNHSCRRCRAGRGLPPRVRRAGAQRQCGARRPRSRAVARMSEANAGIGGAAAPGFRHRAVRAGSIRATSSLAQTGSPCAGKRDNVWSTGRAHQRSVMSAAREELE